ncbi:hypothetical protein Thini_1991 [Thiothrix nivea DSM 5205]|uniref:Uncharacterized protein n=1 Tax=Thiothrix nivea (strain ATCC 35100 / DSM 5205 / JP2) TaxID=870187 RepID=A0A656HHQ8_THINJ|nr:hypothetical protein Thini_1991 [Thiothrix nivea DSM 5205]
MRRFPPSVWLIREFCINNRYCSFWMKRFAHKVREPTMRHHYPYEYPQNFKEIAAFECRIVRQKIN